MLRLLNYCKVCLVVILAIASLTLTACNQLVKNQASQGTQLVQAILSDPKTFNPVLSQDATSSSVGSMILEGLIEQNPITGENEPALAESWQFSADKLKIVFTLKKDLKWSDGHPLTADDVVFSYNQLYLNEAIPTGARDVIRIGQSGALPKVKKLNELQIEFTIPEPFAPFLGSTSLEILPAHILKETVAKKDRDGNPVFLSTWSVDTPPDKIVASGAYKLKSYATSQRIVFEKNPNYWGRNKQGDRLPYIQQVIWEIVESTDTSLLQFRSGSLDSIGISPEYFSLLKKEENRGNFTIYNGGPDYGTNFIVFNLNKGTKEGKPLVGVNKSRWFNNIKFRQAISYAVDRQRMVNNIYRGLGKTQTSSISVQSPYYFDGLKGYEYNPNLAKQILQEAGFKYNDRQELLDADGNRVRFSLNTNAGNKIREAMGSQIKEDLNKIGIKVDFSPIAFNVLVDRLDNSLEWECILLGLTGGNEPNNGANIWFTDGNLHMFNQDKPEIKGREVADWETEIQQLFIEGARKLEESERKTIYAEIQKIEENYVPFIYLVNPLALGAVRNNIQPIQYSALGGAFWNLERLKITE